MNIIIHSKNVNKHHHILIDLCRLCYLYEHLVSLNINIIDTIIIFISSDYISMTLDSYKKVYHLSSNNLRHTMHVK